MRNQHFPGLLRNLWAKCMLNRRGLTTGAKKVISVALCVFMLAPNVTYSVAYASAGTEIELDGRTATTVTPNAGETVFDITTDTIVNQNAFNSFLKFNIGSGDTVNLHVPSGANNLLNLVHGERSDIYGTLNSIKDEQIGGNVYFLNPYGVMVGSTGVINVGSLTLLTPTESFMDTFFISDGEPREDAVKAVLGLEGSVPISASGLIKVQGKINAIGDITLSGGSVEHSGDIFSGAVFRYESPDFSDVVNVAGLVDGSVISTEDGNIVIKAVSDLDITGGTVTAAHEGDITLLAAQTHHTDDKLVIQAEASANITLSNATLSANNITIRATSDAQHEFKSKTPLLARLSSDKTGGYQIDEDVVVTQASAVSEVIVGADTVIDAQGKVELLAHSTALAKSELKETESNTELSVDFMYGEVVSDATVDIQDGAAIKGSNLTVLAKNTSTLDMNVQSISKRDEALEAAIGLAVADIKSLARIQPGATIEIADSVSLGAVNENSFSVNVIAKARQDGLAGLAAAFLTAKTNAQALSDADLTGLKNLTVEALDDTVKNVVKASSVTGGQETSQKIGGLGKKGFEFIRGKTEEKAPQPDDKSSTDTDNMLKIAGTATFVITDHSSVARIGDSATVTASEDVAVSALTRNAGLQNKAQAGVTSKGGTEADDLSIGAALAFGDYKREATAYIGTSAEVQAKRVGVGSEIVMPYSIEELIAGFEFDLTKYKDKEYISNKLKEMKDQLDDPFLTAYANATDTGADFGIAGSMSFMTYTNNSQAYVGENAHITLLAGDNEAWSKTTPSQRTLQWDAPLSVSARTAHTGVYAAGNFAYSLKGTGGQPDGESVGGAYNQVNHYTTTRAYIADGVTVVQPAEESRDVSVTAKTVERIIALGPTSGRGGSIGLSGMFSLSNVNSTT